MYNPILFVIDSNGDVIKKSGIVRAINGYREYAVVISPLSTASLSMSIMTDNSIFDKKEQYVLPTSHKVSDFVSEEDGLFQDIYDWNVYAVEIKEVALESVALFRTGRTTFSFQFQRIKASDKCVLFKGYFGVDSQLPVTAEIGDYYECEDYQYVIASGNHNYALTKGMLVYYNGTRWVKDRLLVELNTPTVEVAVEPSHATGYQLDDDDVNYLLPLGNDIIEALEKSNLALQKIEDIKNGIDPFDELSVQDELGNRMSITYDGKDPVISFRGIKGELFKNLYVEVEPAVGVTFTNGMQIMYAGSIGGSGKRLAKPTNLVELKANPTLYLGTITQVTEDNHGIANWFGVVNGLDTSGATLGAPVYVGDNGSWTLVKPISPLPIIRVGLIERVNNAQGQISVRPSVGNYLNQLHDVYTNGHTFVGGETIMFNLANGRYEVYNLAGKLLQVDLEIQGVKDSKVDKILTIIGLDLQNNISLEEFKVALGNVTQFASGLSSPEDKVHLDNIVALFNADGDDVVNTIAEILAVFQNFPEGATILEVLATKVDKVSGKQLSTNDLTNTLKDYYDTAYAHSQIINSNPHQTTYAQLLNKPVTIEQAGILNVYNKQEIDLMKDKNGWEDTLLGTLSNNGTIALSIINQYDEIQMYAKDTLGVIDNENIRPSLMQSGDSVYFFDDTQAFIMVDTVFGFYAPVGYTLQVVGLKYTDSTAEEVSFDGTSTNYLASETEVDGAIKTLDGKVKDNANAILTKITNYINTPITALNNKTLKEVYEDNKIANIDSLTSLTRATKTVTNGELVATGTETTNGYISTNNILTNKKYYFAIKQANVSSIGVRHVIIVIHNDGTVVDYLSDSYVGSEYQLVSLLKDYDIYTGITTGIFRHQIGNSSIGAQTKAKEMIIVDVDSAGVSDISQETLDYWYEKYLLFKEKIDVITLDNKIDELETELFEELTTKYMDENVYVQHTGETNFSEFIIYKQASYGDGSYYLGTRIHRFNNTLTNGNIWALSWVKMFKRDENNNFIYVPNTILVEEGEWECAIFEVGATDFIGGNSHGDEQYIDFVMLLDGRKLLPTGNYIVYGKNIEMIITSTLNRQDTPLDIVAEHQKHYIINKQEIILEQRVKWLQSVNIERAYLTMLPVNNVEDGGLVVSNKGFFDEDYSLLDFGLGHTNDTLRNNSKSVTLFNDGVGHQFRARVEELYGSDVNEHMSVASAPNYNKVYVFHNFGKTTSIGEVWRYNSRFTYDYSGIKE